MKVVVGVDESLGHRSIGVSRFASGSSFAGGRASGRLPATRKFGVQGRSCCVAALDCGKGWFWLPGSVGQFQTGGGRASGGALCD